MPSRLLSWLAGWSLPAGLCALAFVAGYARGDHVANLGCEARIAALKVDWAERERVRAEAVAEAERNARERLRAAVARGDGLARDLAVKTADLDAERASVTRRLRDVAANARRDCAGLSPEWVRLYNEALYGPGRGPGSEGDASGNAADASGSAGSARAGIQPDALTTPGDVLVHARDYGLYCRKLEAVCRAARRALSSGDADVAGTVD